MTSTPETARPRGLAVWAGLDSFGEAVVGRLEGWLAEGDAASDLAEANRLLPRIRLTASAAAGSMAADDDPGAAAIEAALADLLHSSLARRALRHADRDILAPHVWLVGDIDSADTADLADWLARLHARLAGLQVQARVALIVRNRSWGRSPADRDEVTRRVKALVDAALAPGRPGADATIVYVVADRDGIGARYTPDEDFALVSRFADFVLLADAPNQPLPEAGRAFTAPRQAALAGWETLPVFASVAADALLWQAPGLFAANAERRATDLLAALNRPAPDGWQPAAPDLRRIDAGALPGWQSLDLPRWSPRFWDTPRSEHERVSETLDRWLTAATRWRHDMLVTHEDRRATIQAEAERARRDYAGELDARTRAILRDAAMPGLFSPLKRLYERCQADLWVRRSDLKATPGITPVPADAVVDPAAIAQPREALAGTDAPLTDALERTINPWLLAQVALLTALMAWFWSVTIARNLAASLLGWAIRLVAGVPFLPADVSGWVRGWLDWTPVDPLRLSLYLGVAIIAPTIGLAVFTALRARIRLERAYKRVHDAARGWRDDVADSLPTTLTDLERALARGTIAFAEMEVQSRSERLDALRRRSEQAAAPPAAVDPTISHELWPAQEPPPPLTELQTEQIVHAFRTGCLDEPGLSGNPDASIRCLYREAARIAGDPEPDLRLELPMLLPSLAAAAPPVGAIRARQFSGASPVEFAEPATARFLAAPKRVAPDLSPDAVGAPVLPIPSPDRFYAVLVQTGMSARRVWSLPPSAPDRAAGNGANGHDHEAAASPATTGRQNRRGAIAAEPIALDVDGEPDDAAPARQGV